MWIADASGNRIVRLTTDGAATSSPSRPPAGSRRPSSRARRRHLVHRGPRRQDRPPRRRRDDHRVPAADAVGLRGRHHGRPGRRALVQRGDRDRIGRITTSGRSRAPTPGRHAAGRDGGGAGRRALVRGAQRNAIARMARRSRRVPARDQAPTVRPHRRPTGAIAQSRGLDPRARRRRDARVGCGTAVPTRSRRPGRRALVHGGQPRPVGRRDVGGPCGAVRRAPRSWGGALPGGSGGQRPEAGPRARTAARRCGDDLGWAALGR